MDTEDGMGRAELVLIMFTRTHTHTHTRTHNTCMKRKYHDVVYNKYTQALIFFIDG